ncbi:MAG TPA: Rieske (2Fe-2S) protein [Candidatus Deferrimicrobiaceae bacterium]|nr:Rieske (2Fe-2S) protein [Candidatus Deferrimicrobiaceae bacterium]
MEPTGSETTWTCAVDALGPGQTARFDLLRGERRVQAFLVNHEGGHHAYVNRCPHAGTPLDAWPNEFFTEDGRYLICATHGAVFAPDTGLCLEGPCPGARLERLTVARRGDELVVSP